MMKRSPGTYMQCLLFVVCTTTLAQNVTAGPAEGNTLFTAKQCNGCHIVKGPVEPLPIEERATLKGPPLWFAGSKFEEPWLGAWLQDPRPIRRVVYPTLDKGSFDHPKLSNGEAQDVVAYLMTLVDDDLQTGIMAGSQLNRRAKMQAAKLFTKKQVCFGCHEYPARSGDIGGFSGPSLTGAGTRLNADWIYALIRDPVHFYPNGRMPVYGDKAYTPFTEDEFKSLALFVKSFE